MMVRPSHAAIVLFSVLAGSDAGSVARKALIKGVSYGPIPLKSTEGAAQVPADDWFCDEAVTMWGSAGRGDLRVMKQLGANMVRLYGNNPDNDHTNFLDEAFANGLSVAPGMSDFPYYQMRPGNCMVATDYNCFTQVKPLYAQMLRKGFLTPSGRYHPALKYMNIINEPDLKMPPNADGAGLDAVYQMARSIVSAFDGMLEAEKELGVHGPLINFTATFSFAICGECEMARGIPALSQMAQLDDAMRNPGKYGYVPKNDITAAYNERFTHSFNTANPAQDVKSMFLDRYEEVFPTTPVYIAEYHRVGANQSEDLELIMDIAEVSPLFLGISFFQFQVAYWKYGMERDFGMFGLGDLVLGSMPYVSKTYPIYCLEPVSRPSTHGTLPDALTRAFGGPGLEKDTLCAASPQRVSVDQAGFEDIAALQNPQQMSEFALRLIHNMGAVVAPGEDEAFESFSLEYSNGTDDVADGFARMASDIGSNPWWINFDAAAKCVANRNAHPEVIGQAIGWACAQGVVDCEQVPQKCQENTYRLGDYVLSRYFEATTGADPNPLVTCSFQGAATFAPSEVYTKWTGTEQCVSATVRTTTTPSTTTPRSAVPTPRVTTTPPSGANPEETSKRSTTLAWSQETTFSRRSSSGTPRASTSLPPAFDVDVSTSQRPKYAGFLLSRASGLVAPSPSLLAMSAILIAMLM